MFKSSGILQYDPGKGTRHFDAWWALLICNDDIADYYSWLMKRYGIEVNSHNLWNVHISVLKGEEPPNKENWGHLEGYEIEFNYNHIVRWENGKHAWIDVYSEDLSYIREMMGFPFKPWYHLTIGKLVRPYAL
jgi:hypothetical protein